MIEFLKSREKNVLTLKATDKITKDDVDEVVIVLDKLHESVGKVNVILHLEELKGYTFTSLVDDMKYATKHMDKIEKMAIIGDKKFQEISTHLPEFTKKTEVRYFTQQERSKAEEWIHAKTKEFSR